MRSGVGTDPESQAAHHQETRRVLRMDHEAMNVVVEVCAEAGELTPGLARIVASQKITLFDAGVDRCRIVGGHGDYLYVSLMRRAGKSPSSYTCTGSQGRTFAPMLT